MKTFRFLSGFIALMSFAVNLTAQTAVRNSDDKKPFNDAEFVKKASSGGLHEVELGKLAETSASNKEVIKFADRMVTDHSKAGQELKDIAKAEGFAVTEKQLPEHQKEFDALKSLTGAMFDKEYVKHMVKDHEEDVHEFTRASKEAKNPRLRAFAEKTLPVIKEHLEIIRKLETKFE
ncbi:DUF4142 domain-containing protein [Telmatocola sphagniphila]|uniref:DUF4142 domain-containing protein n=1 Tax=Telmatocola sphagniphila TaxID=1123043 RepID=A0A8E6EU17_9BACT|nr:DUF4142 domain-containing protein [Telmatocola sphagniphila]QVL30820.1 DUF4142 domain-containing protein [Telmatocola sphagniphila]